jgi:glycosyltransferase involved in cell wall biosynthesis
MYSTTPFKGVDLALAAIARARRRHPDLRVMAFGREDPRPSLPLPEGARFVRAPAQDSLRDLYAQCDVFLMGSRSEGFGLPVLEAMACRTPVVATRTGCAPDVIAEGVNGFTVPVGDDAAFGDRIADLLDRDPEAWRAMSDAALARVEGYSWADAARRFEAALRAP